MVLTDLIRVIRKRVIAAAVTFCIVFVGVVAFLLISPTKYTATAELFATYSGHSDSTQDSADMNSGAAYLSTQIQTYPKLIKTEAVLQPVIDDLGLNTQVSELAKNVTATNPTGTFMVDISVETNSAKLSADVANSAASNLSKQISSSLYSDANVSSPIQLTVVEKAQVPASPSSPKIPLYLAAGLLLGIILAICVALLMEAINTKIDDSEEVKALTKTSALGMVPRSKAFEDTRPAVVGVPGGSGAEEFRRIRTNITFLNPNIQERGQLVVFTSTEAAEGKTNTAVNTAAAIAEDGKTVLLIDADLRHPSVAHFLGIEGHAGLTHVLSRQASPVDVVQKYWKRNFHVLPAGKRPGNASILLNSETMRELVQQALLQYDYVIVDTAPLSVANDAVIFGKMGDGIVLVVGKGVAEKKELELTVQSLKDAKVSILGFVFNFADPKKIHSKNYYYYDESTKMDSGVVKDKKKNKRH